MPGVALSFALETALLTYLLVEFGPENGGEIEIPDSANLFDLVEAANEINVLNAPINIPSHLSEGGQPPKQVARDAVDRVRRFRNLIHPARALKGSCDPRTFGREQLTDLKELCASATHSLLYYL